MDGLVVMQMKDTTTQSRIGRVNNGSSIWEWKCKHESASKHSSRLRNNNLKMCECVALWKKVRHNCLHNTQGIQVHQKWLWERFGSFKWDLKTVLKMNMGAGVVRYTGETETVPLYSPQGTLSLSSYEGGGEKKTTHPDGDNLFQDNTNVNHPWVVWWISKPSFRILSLTTVCISNQITFSPKHRQSAKWIPRLSLPSNSN